MRPGSRRAISGTNVGTTKCQPVTLVHKSASIYLVPTLVIYDPARSRVELSSTLPAVLVRGQVRGRRTGSPWVGLHALDTQPQLFAVTCVVPPGSSRVHSRASLAPIPSRPGFFPLPFALPLPGPPPPPLAPPTPCVPELAHLPRKRVRHRRGCSRLASLDTAVSLSPWHY